MFSLQAFQYALHTQEKKGMPYEQETDPVTKAMQTNKEQGQHHKQCINTIDNKHTATTNITHHARHTTTRKDQHKKTSNNQIKQARKEKHKPKKPTRKPRKPNTKHEHQKGSQLTGVYPCTLGPRGPVR
jgi:hypothetical protein